MERIGAKRYHRLIRKQRIRKKIIGSALRPRITGYRSNRYLFVQAVNDEIGTTITSATNISGTSPKSSNRSASASSTNRPKKRNNVNCEVARQLGEKLGQDLIKKNITRAVFDCNGYRYHGIIRAVAEGVRKTGISF